MAHVMKTTYNGDVNIGLFALATDEFWMAPADFPELEVLKVPRISCTASDTPLIGLFVVANSNGIVLPKITEKREVDALKKRIKEVGKDINISVLRTKYTVLGNLIVCNDKGALISENLRASAKKIEDTLGVEVVTGSIAGSKLPGSYAVATNKGFLLSNLGSEDDYALLESVLKVEGDLGSVNFGSNFVRSGLIANSNGYVVGEPTTGVELTRIDEALGFLE